MTYTESRPFVSHYLSDSEIGFSGVLDVTKAYNIFMR